MWQRKLLIIVIFVVYIKSSCAQHCTWCKDENILGYSVGGIYNSPRIEEKQPSINNLVPVERSGMIFDNFAGGTRGQSSQYLQVYEDQNGNRFTQNDLPNLSEINN